MKIRLEEWGGLVFGLLLLAVTGCGSEPSTPSPRSMTTSPNSSLHCAQLPFVENVFWTTDYGPAAADIKSATTNFLPCNGPAYALCYYSGAEPMPCTLDEERGIALCQCYGFQSQTETYDYFIDINAILNTCAYIETVRDCGHDGAACFTTTNSAPACQYMNQSPQALQPTADLVSTFSFAKVEEYGEGCTECSGVYAGCMTAACYERQNDQGETVVICECPLYEGPYQVGRSNVQCNLGDSLVWSAAYDTSGCAG